MAETDKSKAEQDARRVAEWLASNEESFKPGRGWRELREDF